MSDAPSQVRILENTLVMVDPRKLEMPTHGEWRLVVCRCLSLLLDIKCIVILWLLMIIYSIVAQRMCSSRWAMPELIARQCSISTLVDRSADCLKMIEKTVP